MYLQDPKLRKQWSRRGLRPPTEKAPETSPEDDIKDRCPAWPDTEDIHGSGHDGKLNACEEKDPWL
jgi:hypothetical protein